MMKKRLAKNIKLGIFVSIGILFFIGAVYFIGANQNLFGSTIRLSAIFHSVNGLQVGNNVRFAGINVGTVERISLVSDTTVRVSFVVEEEAAKYIKQDSEATIASEGLMGNKVLNISSGTAQAGAIEDGMQLPSAEPIEIEDIIADLKVTAEQAKAISQNITAISSMIKRGEGTIGRLLTDPDLVNSFNRMIYTLQASGNNILEITDDFTEITNNLQSGKGVLGKLLTDKSMTQQVTAVLDSMQVASNNAAKLSRQLKEFSKKLNNTQSTVGLLLTDTTLAENLEETMLNIKAGSDDLEATIQKINNSWLLNLFSNKEKKESKKEQRE